MEITSLLAISLGAILANNFIFAQFPAMQMVMPVGGFLTLGFVIAGSQWLMKKLDDKKKEVK